MRNLIDRILVLLKAAPTYLTAVAVIIGIIIGNLDDLPFDAPPVVVAWLAAIAATAAVAAAIVRQVTPVISDARGLLPADGPATDAERELLLDRLPPKDWRDQLGT